MKYSKLIAVVASSTGLGALIGWAITADVYEDRLKRNGALLTDMLTKQNKELQQLYSERVRFLTKEEIAKIPFEEGGPLLDEDDEIVQPPTVSEDHPVPGLSRSARIIKDLELRSVNLVAEEPNPDNGVFPIEVVPDGESLTDYAAAHGGVVVESPITEVAGEETGVETEEIAHAVDEEGENVIPEGETPEETRSNLQALIDKYASSPEDRDIFVARAVKETSPGYEAPKVISQAEYAYGEDGEHYAKITLTYYERARMLLDDEKDPIEVGDYIGWNSLNSFGGDSGDPDVVFVRNDRLATDFEVVRDQESDVPIHVRYKMSEDEFKANVSAGHIKLEDYQ